MCRNYWLHKFRVTYSIILLSLSSFFARESCTSRLSWRTSLSSSQTCRFAASECAIEFSSDSEMEVDGSDISSPAAPSPTLCRITKNVAQCWNVSNVTLIAKVKIAQSVIKVEIVSRVKRGSGGAFELSCVVHCGLRQVEIMAAWARKIMPYRAPYFPTVSTNDADDRRRRRPAPRANYVADVNYEPATHREL